MPSEPTPFAERVCPGSSLRGAPKRRFDGGFWRPCSVCGRRFLPKYGGVMPEHKRHSDGADT